MNTSLDKLREFIILQGETLELSEMIPISDIQDLFELEGYQLEELNDNTNGWSIDFWYYFKHSEKARYCVSGSLWYGDFKIYKKCK